ncbi:MAG: hypothetical protein HN726_03150 [Candidatus Magasanikbacteria bacterium]|jgi:hypothetical protein|nr:hypothetical protein [Candidatus Magasanikbacteria bacterium]MBT4221041.1 hypothetical protein [Candidatus Magasanikbacteria bacterium]MBT4350615.1 hypothetical protein [Candidatus Magasanikbacteria bacterium]MBT4542086.1 hypothetical protein [Candidatus Magasanikbacteria bacterium]MBT6253602.1 hypothetical protein [Candidatus Magasanikbacteria bacterium]
MTDKKTLTPEALSIIDAYKGLSFGGTCTVSTPYMNNKRQQVRAALRVLIGKGSSEEIVEEATLIALRENTDLTKMNEKDLRTFLIDHNLGIDCSGLVYHVLTAEYRTRYKKSLSTILSFVYAKNIIRKMLSRFRPIENTNVSTLAHEKNSTPILLKDISPGDLIAAIEAKGFGTPNHILIVHEVTYVDNLLSSFSYTHSLRWKTDDTLTHGVRQGTVTIINEDKSILEQRWEEQGHVGEKNQTLALLLSSNAVSLLRLKQK